MHHSDEGASLVINGVEGDDSGNIKCVISNKNGSDECQAKLVATIAPTLVSQVPPQSADLGEPHKVKFSFYGTGPFEFRVKRNGREIPSTEPRIKLNTFDDHAKLTFSGESQVPI